MARTSWNPEVGPLPANTGGKHGGADRAFDSAHSTRGQVAGNPGTEVPWRGPDSTPKPGQVPPITHLGGN